MKNFTNYLCQSNEELYHDEIWDHCLKCGEHWFGLAPSCKCDVKSYHVKEVSMPLSGLTHDEKVTELKKMIHDATEVTAS